MTTEKKTLEELMKERLDSISTIDDEIVKLSGAYGHYYASRAVTITEEVIQKECEKLYIQNEMIIDYLKAIYERQTKQEEDD